MSFSGSPVNATLIRTKTEAKIAALENLVVTCFSIKHRAEEMRAAARVITDLLQSDMSDEERAAAWVLIQYAKRKEDLFREAHEKAACPAEESD